MLWYAHFVPNLSMGASIVSSLNKQVSAFFDVHMMVSNPDQWIKSFATAGSSQYTFHFEAVGNDSAKAIHLAKEIVAAGMRAGLSVKPKTPIESTYDALDSGLFSVLLIMTVEPGFGGQSFMADMMEKVILSRRRYPNMDIEVDGGLNEATTKIAITSGANVIVAGTSIFKSPDISVAATNMLQLMNHQPTDALDS
ncbi:ribulose-phosphate 3 epimerase family protein [Cardiosporidium cionae]|uniref:Ribulose-phosphate 3 epimerase family protein n=1 Tax=Cardiosporidium cionae TaxID=476202 RepID=A0ABQ7JA51_9APIC|nr:ribulose-phosphate 3 epimerase family protein [Cardiosporidium cionae]|eukprot:KAF8820857.1 ribulose-phosphate 3 epimerase family protein [Cardiosporidium cionae]